MSDLPPTVKIIDRPYFVLRPDHSDYELKVEVHQTGAVTIFTGGDCCAVELTPAEGRALQQFIVGLQLAERATQHLTYVAVPTMQPPEGERGQVERELAERSEKMCVEHGELTRHIVRHNR